MAAIQSRLTFLRLRRVVALIFTLIAVWITWVLLESVRRSLGDPAMTTGWTLLASTLGLYGLGIRKRFKRRSLGRVAAWLQVHTYLGIFALVIFCWHVGWPVRGLFESALASVFLFIAVSGGVLIWYSRRIPKQLAALKCDYRLEDIASVQAELAATAHNVAIESSDAGSGATLAEYYQRRLISFFHAPRSLFYRCVPTGVKRRHLLRELEDLDRYLNADGRAYRVRLSTLVTKKDDTDFHHALQLRLRFLVTTHVALTWSLLLLIVVHVVLVLRFQGAMV
jgi:cytochrome b561